MAPGEHGKRLRLSPVRRRDAPDGPAAPEADGLRIHGTSQRRLDMPKGYDHIACCLDGSDGSRRALEEAARLAELSGARLTVVHVFELPEPRGGLSEGATWMPNLDQSLEISMRWLEEEAAEAPGGEAVLLGPGHAPSAVCEWASEAGVDLLVAGANRSFLERVLLGSFAGYLARHAPCPVLLVRPLASSDDREENGAHGARVSA
jgi:nucleotide-binding universal stress UspA family protein